MTPTPPDEDAMTRELLSDPEPRAVGYALYLVAILVAFSPWIVAQLREWLS